MIQDPDYHIWGTYFTESCLVYSFFLHWHSNYLCLKCFDSWLSTRKGIWTVKISHMPMMELCSSWSSGWHHLCHHCLLLQWNPEWFHSNASFSWNTWYQSIIKCCCQPVYFWILREQIKRFYLSKHFSLDVSNVCDVAVIMFMKVTSKLDLMIVSSHQLYSRLLTLHYIMIYYASVLIGWRH